MFKILAYELAAHDDEASCRQVFVTQSGPLAQRVKAYYDQLKQSSIDFIHEEKNASTASVTATAPSLRALKASTQRDPADSDLPLRFGDLKDRHFPLFVTFEEASTIYNGITRLY